MITIRWHGAIRIKCPLAHLFAKHCKIHARADSMPPAERRRKLFRPVDTYRSPGIQGQLQNTDSRVVLSPTQVSMAGGRKANTSEYRERLQLTRSPAQLLKCIRDALDSNNVDASVFGAAIQRCGQSRWWNALHQVRSLQRTSGIAFETILLGQFLTALAKCARGEYGFGLVEARQSQIVELGRLAWNEAVPHIFIDHITVCAALNLCAAASPDKDMAGLHWANELHMWASKKQMPLDVIHYSAFVRVLETYKMTDQVDNVIDDSRQQGWVPNAVFLGGLVNVAAERHDWQRAEHLWRKISKDFGVAPTTLSCSALAKAHLLSGQPGMAVQAIDHMLNAGCVLTPEAAELHIQSLLVVYHASLTYDSLCRLQDAFHRGKPLIETSSVWQIQVLHRMWEVFRCIRSSPRSVRLHDVLLEWKATRSNMAKWDNFNAGSNYLEHLPTLSSNGVCLESYTMSLQSTNEMANRSELV